MKKFKCILLLLFLISEGQLSAQIMWSKVEKGETFYFYCDGGKINIYNNKENIIKVSSTNGSCRTDKVDKVIEFKVFSREGFSNAKNDVFIPEDVQFTIVSAGGDIEFHDKHSASVNISTTSGNISIETLNGDAELSTGGGDIKIENINGNLKIYETVGNIRIKKISGSADIKTLGGDINIQSIEKSLDANTKAGLIEIGDIGSEAKIINQSGNIKTGNIKGKAFLNSNGGEITIKGVIGNVVAKSSGGDLNLGNIQGAIEAQTFGGKITVSLFPGKSSKSIMVSGFGDIILSIPKNFSAYVHARIKQNNETSGKKYEIKSNMALSKNTFKIDNNTTVTEGKTSKHTGTESIYLETTNSNIEIKKLKN